VRTEYRGCDISITAPLLNSESMEWHCDICLTIRQGEGPVDIKNTHTFSVNSQEETLEAAVSLAKEMLDSILPEK